ncbi:MAG: hypothetical protein ACI4GA_06880 [Acutalibacteraceae bacterium]
MKQKLINKNSYVKVCENCANGRLSADKDRVLCVRCGIMRLDSTCRDYKYDPLKRQPKRPKKIEKFSEDEFRL